MQTHRQSVFSTIRTEGAILPPDLLQRIANGDPQLDGLEPESYHLLKGERINEAINRSWSRLESAWITFKKAKEQLPKNDFGTTITRERWLLPLFQELGYGRLLTAKAIELNGRTYPISHQWQNTPIHLVGCNVDLDHRTAGIAGAARSSPHSLVQELLNCSDAHLWGFVSNGLSLRILRDNVSLTRQAYVEFDFEMMMNGGIYPDFTLLWLLCHQSRVESEKPESCWLERWSRVAQVEGTRALEQLREGVEDAINALGGGFLAHSGNIQLKEKLKSGELGKQDYYRQILRLVYRLLFLFVAEDRDLLLNPDCDEKTKQRYMQFYSLARIRGLAEKHKGTRHSDLYHGIRLVMDKLGDISGCHELGLPALGSMLFDKKFIPDLNDLEISNSDFLDSIRSLAFITDGSKRRPVDYKNLRSEELGSVYESLLELHPELNTDSGTFRLQTTGGNERKTTGSYYTPESLVQCLLDSALDPVLDDAVKDNPLNPPLLRGKDNPSKKLDSSLRWNDRKSESLEQRILNLKICDPACGSGHFLIAASHRIARRLASIRTGDDEPSPEAIRTALRDVIGHCVYGVDINPMAVELCKVSLWMEALEPGKPLSFLDHHIQCGNSLLGATPKLLNDGIPDDAFKPIEGDDKAICSEYRKRNKEERQGYMHLFNHDMSPWNRMGDLAASMMQLEDIPDNDIEGVQKKQERYQQYVNSSSYGFGHLWADMWCSAFVWKKTRELPYPITENYFRKVERNPFDIPDWMKKEIKRLSEQYQFFHWHLEFPDVFRVPVKDEEAENEKTGWIGGFDVVLGNPPWERIKLQEQEWFAERNPDIANAQNASIRQKMIFALKDGDPSLYYAFLDARRQAEGESHLIRNSERFPLCGKGDINTYAIFAELSRDLLKSIGRAGIIAPTGVATDNTTKEFFDDLVKNRSLESYFGFKNERFLFAKPVEHTVTFGLLTMLGTGIKSNKMEFCWLAYTIEHKNDPGRRVILAQEDFALMNPNTKTCPVFRTRTDAELTRKIYQRVPVLINEKTGSNLWGIKFSSMFHMANDSGLFCTREQLPDYRVVGNKLIKDDSVYLPLYEAKMIHQFDHRYGSYESRGVERGFATLPEVPLRHLQDSHYAVRSFYYVKEMDVLGRLSSKWDRKWLLGFRDVTSNTSERTAIFSPLPRAGAGHTMPLIFLGGSVKIPYFSLFLANMNCLVFDYIARQKVAGIHLTYGYLQQLPVLLPSAYNESDLLFIVPRVLELVHTAFDIKPFADDLWDEMTLALREAVLGQIRPLPERFNITPQSDDQGGCPFPPFVWNEDRRARIRAELDAYYARLYGLTEEELRYILDPQDVYGEDFPGETFRVLKEKEIKQLGEYRTKRLVLEAWEKLKR